MKKNHGITLVALVITIVVMLILVGVTITLTINGGLFDIAEDAKTRTEKEKTKEQLSEILAEYGIQKYLLEGEENLVEYLENELGNDAVTYNEEDDIVTVVINGQEITINTNGNIVARPGLKIGDYINYTPTIPTNAEITTLNTEVNTYSGYSTTQTLSRDPNIKWQILNIHEDGTVDLVSTPTTGTVYFKGAKGYNNGVYLMHDICRVLYSNTTLGVTARSINLKDIEDNITPAGIVARNEYQNSYGQVKNDDTFTYKGAYSFYPNLYAQENKSGINIDEEPNETIKERLKKDGIDNEAPAQLDVSTEGNAKKQANTKGLTATQTFRSVLLSPTNYGEASSVLTSEIYYWVASRSVGCNNGYAGFALCHASNYIDGYGIFHSNGNPYSRKNCLRSIVSLGPNIQIERCTGTNGVNNPHIIPALAD